MAGVRTSGSLLAHVVPGRHERVALAEARLRDLGEVRSSVEDRPEAAVDVVPPLRGAVTWPLTVGATPPLAPLAPG